MNRLKKIIFFAILFLLLLSNFVDRGDESARVVVKG